MTARLRRALEARRASSARDEGFSLIELLVVVIVIGILAAVAIPIYTGVSASAREASVKSDLSSAKTFMVATFTKDQAYPQTVSELVTAGFTPGGEVKQGSTINLEIVNVSSSSFCLRAWTSSDTTRDMWVSSGSGIVGPIPVGATEQRPAGCS